MGGLPAALFERAFTIDLHRRHPPLAQILFILLLGSLSVFFSSIVNVLSLIYSVCKVGVVEFLSTSTNA